MLSDATTLLLQVIVGELVCSLLQSSTSAFVVDTSALWRLQLLVDVRASEGHSEDAEELCHLLRQPHLQVRRTAVFPLFRKSGVF